ncbi:MAG: DNRLRE domain-containing protein, partial [Phycisphaerae bacterium]|nr:DNRLRE domain-containing protein [Phycisphaerae bacterium]
HLVFPSQHYSIKIQNFHLFNCRSNILTRNVNDGNFAICSREHNKGGAILSVALMPAADTYVRNGSYASDNYGSDTSIIVKNDGSSYTRQSILRFDYNNKGSGDVTNAILTLTPLGVQSSTTLRIRLVDDADDFWDEYQMNWNNLPAADGMEIIIPGSSITVGQPNSVDVTELLTQTKNQNHVATFIIDSLVPVQYSYTSFVSRQHESFAKRPKLSVTLTDMFDAGDINFDRKVSLDDFMILTSYWLNSDCGSFLFCNGADIDNDNDVDMDDLKAMAHNWLN